MCLTDFSEQMFVCCPGACCSPLNIYCLSVPQNHSVCVYLPFVVSTKLRPHRWRRGSWSKRFVVEARVWCWHMPVWVWVCLFTSNVHLGVDGAAYVWEDWVEKARVWDLRSAFFFFTAIACDWVYQAKPQLPDFFDTYLCLHISAIHLELFWNRVMLCNKSSCF